MVKIEFKEIVDNVCAYRHHARNQNPNYVVFCELENRLIVRIKCRDCKRNVNKKRVLKKLGSYGK